VKAVLHLLQHHKWIIAAFITFLVLAAGVELWMGRLRCGPDGTFGFLLGNITSSKNPQRLANSCSFGSLVYGILFSRCRGSL
jgi:hypothetical protein